MTPTGRRGRLLWSAALGVAACAPRPALPPALPSDIARALASGPEPPVPPSRCDATVRAYGARGDGSTDDTGAFNDAIWYLPVDATLCVPAGTYMIDGARSVQLKSRMTMWLAPGAILRAKPTRDPQYAVVKIWKHSDVTIYGGVIEGERMMHTGSSGEWGMGIDVKGASRVTIRAMTIRDCWGDGILIDGFDDRSYIDPATDPTYSSDVQIIDVTADGNRRQGVSIVSGRNITLVRPRLLNTHGTGPGAGIDIEPDLPWQTIENIHLIDPLTVNNEGPGILILLDKLRPTSFSTIRIERHTDHNSAHALYLAAPQQSARIDIDAPDWAASKKPGVFGRACTVEVNIVGARSGRIRPDPCT